MIVIHLAETLQGGIATYLSEVFSRSSKGLRHWLIAPVAQQRYLVHQPERLFTVTGSKNRIFTALAVAFELNKAVPSEDAAEGYVIHLHSTFAGLAGRLFSFQPRSKIIYCPHGWAFDQRITGFSCQIYRLVEKLLAYRCRKVVCISEHEYKLAALLGLQADQIALIRNGVGELRDAPKSDNQTSTPMLKSTREEATPKRILFAGRLDLQKGINVITQLPTLLPEDTFIIAGAPVHGNTSINWPRNVDYRGWLSLNEVRELMGKADLVIVPSLWEGFGLVAIEAMQQKTAVFASRVGALKEIVVDGVTGKLIDDYESAADFAIEISTANLETLYSMGEAGYKRQQELYRSDKMVQDLQKLYEEVALEEGNFS